MESTTIKTPGPGVYDKVPADAYHKWDAVSKSKLWRLRQSPAHVLHAQDQTDAMAFGCAFETLLLEPERFAVEYVVCGQCEAKTGKGGQCSRNGTLQVGGVWYCSQHATGPADPINAISPGEAKTLSDMVRSVKAHAVAGDLLAQVKKIQPSLVWQDDKTGLMCKGRLDIWTEYERLSSHVDIKVTADAEPRRFANQATDLGYFAQQAHYRDGCRILSGREDYRRVLIIAVESSPDYGDVHRVEVFEYDESALEAGLKERDSLMRRYAECVASGEWPGREQRIRPLLLPQWKQSDIELLG